MPEIPHILHAVRTMPWFVHPDKFEAILELIALRAQGIRFTAEEVAERTGERRPDTPSSDGIRVIPIRGVIAHHAPRMGDVSGGGGASTEVIGAALDAALADDAVKTIVFEVDSPGGPVFGVDELSQKIFESRGRKRMIAVANAMAASGAYYLATAADELVVTPSGSVGSVGVIYVHQDWSVANEKAGIKPTYITAGRLKAYGNADAPLTDEDRGLIQSDVDRYYEMFVKALARNRGVSAADVRKNFGEGRMLGPKEAVAAGMADRVESMEKVMAKLLAGKRSTSRMRAEVARNKMRMQLTK